MKGIRRFTKAIWREPILLVDIIRGSLVTLAYMTKDFMIDQWDRIRYPQHKKHKKLKRERIIQ